MSSGSGRDGDHEPAIAVTVDVASPVPPFEQIRVQLAAMILAGELSSRTRLPSIRQLAADLGCARGTVARAYAELEASGAVTTARGLGTRVAEHPALSPAVLDTAETFITTARAAGLDLPAMLATLRSRA